MLVDDQDGSEHIVIRTLYVLHNNPETKFADWAAYKVVPDYIGPTHPRHWKADPDLAEEDTLEPEDYERAYAALDTDRGHQVPLASFTGHPEWPTTNYLSNITPQKEDLNRGPWLQLGKAVRRAAQALGEVFVVTGLLYEHEMPELPGADEAHRMPGGYWKVVASAEAGVVAFIFDQDTPRKYDKCDAETELEEVEARAHVNLFPSKAQSTSNQTLARALGCP